MNQAAWTKMLKIYELEELDSMPAILECNSELHSCDFVAKGRARSIQCSSYNLGSRCLGFSSTTGDNKCGQINCNVLETSRSLRHRGATHSGSDQLRRLIATQAVHGCLSHLGMKWFIAKCIICSCVLTASLSAEDFLLDAALDLLRRQGPCQVIKYCHRSNQGTSSYNQ